MHKINWSMKMEIVLEDNTVVGIFFQDPQMMSAFDRFPEVVLMDATYKTNNQDMPLYTMLCIDGNGESQVAASFLVQKEDEASIRKMIQLFKKANSKWSSIKVVMTDKDMMERAIIKSEIPQAALQICLFHVLRTFGREITADKMGITSGEKSTVLSHIQEITYSRNEDEYLTKYRSLCDVMPDRVKDYYNSNWHGIRDEWVEGLKYLTMNLGTRTNNRIESFFSHLKKSIVMRGSLKEFFERYMVCLTTLRTERSHRLLNGLHKQPTKPVTDEELQYRSLLTPYAFDMVKQQLLASTKVEVLSSSTVNSSSGVRDVSNTECECQFANTMGLPCKHILAIRRYNGLDMYCADAVNVRWTAQFYSSKIHLGCQRPRLSIATQQTPRKSVMSERERYKQAGLKLNELQSVMSQCGMLEFKDRCHMIEELITMWKGMKKVTVIEQGEAEYEMQEPAEEELPMNPIEKPQEQESEEIEELPEIEHIPEAILEPGTGLDEETDSDVEVSARDSLPNLSAAVFSTKSKKRGRPCGACTTAIGLPKAKKIKLSKGKPVAFHQKDIQSRQRQILGWLVNDSVTEAVMSGHRLIGEEEVEQDPEEVGCSVRDKHVDINIVRRFFDDDAWTAVDHVYHQCLISSWRCSRCTVILEDDGSICCDSCLNWMHMKCAKLKKSPRTRFWFCSNCK